MYKNIHNALKYNSYATGILPRTVVPMVALLALQASASPAVTAELEELLNGMKSFRAEFRQTVTGHLGEVLQTSTGRMHLERPGRLRWEVDEPYPQLVLADGDSVWVYDPDLEQVTVQPLAETVEGSPAVFMTGVSANLEEHFAVVKASDDGGENGERRFVLTPRDDPARDVSSRGTGTSAGASAGTSAGILFRRITLTFSPGGALTGLDVADHLDQVTAITFQATEVNPVLESSLFDFEVPEGVDVIGNIPTNPSPG